MNQYMLYLRGKQIDCFYEKSNPDAIDWVCANYPENEFGDVSLMLYHRKSDGSMVHVARIPI
jgi:hypothetical protein